MEKKLEVKNLQISFRTQGGLVKAVRNISFDLYKGETLAIVGESGSGKSVTSKAIIGILAGNSIIEGGEILYDGKDLLKIDEDHFHEIRGDKISMIFQDPLSSLNPIMRVGKQLTEAMILNGKARQKNSKLAFNTYLKTLNSNMDEVNPSASEDNKKLCETFDGFCIKSTELELAYNEAKESAILLIDSLKEFDFLIEKRQKVDLDKRLKAALKVMSKTVHRFVLDKDDFAKLSSRINELLILEKNDEKTALVSSFLKEAIPVLEASIVKVAPNFFRLGFYKFAHPDVDIDYSDVEKLDNLAKDILDNEFMLNFIEKASTGVVNSFNKSMAKKKEILNSEEKYMSFFGGDASFENKKEAYKMAESLYTDVISAIDYLDINKKSVEHSFKSTILHDLNSYFDGVKKNPIMQRRYDKKKAKYDSLVASGKTPTWIVTPAELTDLELAKSNVLRAVRRLFNSYKKDIAALEQFNANKKTVDLIDYLKDLASRVVYKVTYAIAKTRALELMKEVGIPEPRIRFNQYPFEFSGGMRQRIVIAIALSANPDILICDEPTTALDVTIQSQILELINKIKVERNLSVIFITHDLGVVANMADRIAVMYAGKIVEYGTSDDLFYDPKHPYTWALLSSMPDLDTKEKLDAIPGTPPNMIYPPKGDAFAERNKYAMQIDFEMEPPMFKVSETHHAATWLLHPNAPKVNPPKIILDRIERMKKGGK